MNMKTKMIAWAVLLSLLCCLFAFPASASVQATVVGGWLRLRAEPSHKAETIASYPDGTVVTVFSRAYGWCQVATPDNRTGYMDENFLVMGQQKVTPVTVRTWTDVNRTAKIISDNGKGVRLRSSPNLGDNVLGLYPVGRTVKVIRQSSDDWSYIKIDRKYGYMMTNFLSIGATDTLLPTEVTTEMIPKNAVLKSIRLNTTSPRVGNRLTVTVNPSGASYSVVWYRDDNLLLSTELSYTVRAADAGHVIHVRVTGSGSSEGITLNKSTATVRARLSSGEDVDTETDIMDFKNWGNPELD